MIPPDEPPDKAAVPAYLALGEAEGSPAAASESNSEPIYWCKATAGQRTTILDPFG